MIPTAAEAEIWPALPYAEWKDTLETLHMWLQIIGKIRMRQEPHLNHWWEVALYVTARGLTTTPMPYKDLRTFQIDFDFIDHVLSLQDCDGETTSFALEPMPVAHFYVKVMESLRSIGVDLAIRTEPNEVANAIPFDLDYTHASYDRTYAHRFWRVLLQADRLFKLFRARFIGKVSPVHLFWGAPDLAVTRFSGRRAPPHPGGIPNLPDWVTQDAYSHEVSSAGFWPGGPSADACFYSYAYPEPQGFAQAQVRPSSGYYDKQFREFVLPYETVRKSGDPDEELLAFLQSTYDAAADLGKWNRVELERAPSS
ncbi:MAG TPA: DUF5996 family protein [Candidatus Baltobacteraceae bacterium]|nr:DUF5996 family protein [Candidatus Baltobacteraceae bacterium]